MNKANLINNKKKFPECRVIAPRNQWAKYDNMTK